MKALTYLYLFSYVCFTGGLVSKWAGERDKKDGGYKYLILMLIVELLAFFSIIYGYNNVS